MPMWTPRTKRSLLANVDKAVVRSKVIARSTLRIEFEDGSTAIHYHDTDVVTCLTDGSYILRTGGHKTVTTKRRINQHTPVASVYQEKWRWWVALNGGGMIEFFDGIHISREGEVLNAGNRSIWHVEGEQ